jgi:hypothetical protein
MSDDNMPGRAAAPEPGWVGTRLPRPDDLPTRVYLRGDGGWAWLDENDREVAGPAIDGASGIIVTVSVGEKRTIYAVTEGSYSDYSIEACFEAEADAEAFVAAGGGDSVEEFDLLPPGVGIATVYTAEWHRPYYVEEREMESPLVQQRIEADVSGDLAKRYQRPVTAEHMNRGPLKAPLFVAECTDREAAIKSVMDRAAAWRTRRFPT